jgi:hypothetical protein
MRPSRVLGAVGDFFRRPWVRGSLIAVLAYALVACVVFYPVPFRLNSVLLGFTGRDGWEHAWWLWFAKRLLLSGKGLDDLYLINHPVGLQHPYQWSLVSYSVIASLLGVVFPPAATYNMMALGSFVTSGLAAYHLCRDLTRSHWASLAGGAIFAFCPNRLGHALAGWLPQMTAYLYPWYALLLIRTLRRPTLRQGMGLGVLSGVAATIWPMHVVYFMIPLTVVIVGFDLLHRRRAFFTDRRVLCLGLAFVICLAVASPFLLPLLGGRFQGDLDYLSTAGIVGHSADLLAFFTPSPYHPVLASLGLVPAFARRVFFEPEALRAWLAYPGLIAVGLALWGVVRIKPRLWEWLLLTIGAALLSLGPILVAGREPVEYVVDGYHSYLPMPYALVRAVPFLDWGRTPGRLVTTAMLGVGVLAAYGLADLLDRLPVVRWQAGMLSIVVVILVIFEYVPIWPFPAGDARVPPVIQYISDQPGDGALLHVPMGRRRVNNRALFFQTVTGRPIVGGEVLRLLPDVPPWLGTVEGLTLADPAPDVIPRPSVEERRAWLRHFDVDWVLLHKLEPADARYRPFIEQLLGKAVIEDDTLVAFSVPDDVAALEPSQLYTLGDYGWYSPERDGGIWRRWLGEEGELYVYSAREERGSLRFGVDSHLPVPVLEVYLDGQLLDAVIVDERAIYTTRPFTLKQGMNVFRFRAPGGCLEVLDSPRCWESVLLEPLAEDGVQPCDPAEVRTTCRTFVFDGMHFVPGRELNAGEGLDIDFGDQMRLRGWELSETALRPGEALTVTLAWEATAKLSDRYIVFVHMLSPDGSLAAQSDKPIGDGLIPYAVWQPGTTFSYPVTLELPGDLPAGDHRLLLGVYLWPSLERLPVQADLPGSRGDMVELGLVEVLP